MNSKHPIPSDKGTFLVEMEMGLVDFSKKSAAFERFVKFRSSLLRHAGLDEFSDYVKEASAFIDAAGDNQTDIRVLIKIKGNSWVEIGRIGDQLVKNAAGAIGVAIRDDDEQEVPPESQIYDEMSRQLANA